MPEQTSSEVYEQYTRIFPYPHERITEGASAEQIMDRYYMLLAQGKEQGYVPVFVRTTDTLLEDILFKLADEHNLPDELDLITPDHARAYTHNMLEKYRASLKDLSVEERGKKEIAENLDLFLEDEEAFFRNMVETFKEPSFLPDGIEHTEQPVFVTISSFEGGDNITEGELLLVQVPTDNPADIPAYLPFGGWNDCPDTESQLAFTHYWYQKYGAIPGLLDGHDTLEFYVERPVTDPNEAKQLAVEQFAFCSDAPTQVFDSFETLATAIHHSKQWYFWWD